MKRSTLVDMIETLITEEDLPANTVLTLIEQYMIPKARPLSRKEIDEHPLVRQVHDSRKDEVRNYVANLDYEWKKEWTPEDDK